MYQYAGISIVDELNGSQFHRLENIMTLARDLHEAFDHLELWVLKENVGNCPCTQRYKSDQCCLES